MLYSFHHFYSKKKVSGMKKLEKYLRTDTHQMKLSGYAYDSVGELIENKNISRGIYEGWKKTGLISEPEDFKEEDVGITKLETEIDFLATLSNSDLSWKNISEFLSELSKPYHYEITGLFYDIGNDRFIVKENLLEEELKKTRVREFEEINFEDFLRKKETNYEDLKKLETIGFLTDLPSKDTILSLDEHKEVDFLCDLLESGLTWDKVNTLLDRLEKPYQYDSNELLYKIENGEFLTKGDVIVNEIKDQIISEEYLKERIMDEHETEIIESTLHSLQENLQDSELDLVEDQLTEVGEKIIFRCREILNENIEEIYEERTKEFELRKDRKRGF